MSRLARSAPYSTELFLKIGVSGVFRYFGPLSAADSLRAPNAITSPDRSLIGQISRPWNLSDQPVPALAGQPPASSSSSVNPSRRRCRVVISQSSGA